MQTRYLAVNPNVHTLNVKGDLSNLAESLEVFYLSKRTSSPCHKEDQVVFGKNASFEEYSFGTLGEIRHVEGPIPVESGMALFYEAFPNLDPSYHEDQNVFRFFVTPTGEIKDALSLHEQRFSLITVSNYSFPYANFNRGLRVLPSVDYRSIVEKRYFVSRSAFGEIMESLPLALKRQFAYETLRDLNLTHPVGLDFREILWKLRDFIQEKILSRGKILQATRDYLQQGFEEICPIDKIGFRETELHYGDPLIEQAGYFDELESFEKQLTTQFDQTFWEYLMSETGLKTEAQWELRQAFNNIPWPIDFN